MMIPVSFISSLLCIGLIALCAAFPSEGKAAESSYLRAGDEIVCVGDSITAQGAYQAYVENTLATLYPAAHIRLVNLGRGGSDAAGQVDVLRTYLAAHHPTVITVMFGVNDTRWSAGDAEKKTADFVAGLHQYATTAQEHGIPLIFLRESHFSHGAQPGVWETGINEMLGKLFTAQTAFAAEHGIPIIDTHGAYLRALSNAWRHDTRYEFTPDVIHPISPGHCAMAVEMLRAFGAGLPLAAGPARGPLHLRDAPSAALEVLDEAGYADVGSREGVAATVRVRNLTAQPLQGTVTWTVGGLTAAHPVQLTAFGAVNVPIRVAVGTLPDRWGALPCYLTFTGEQVFAADGGFFYYSRMTTGAFTAGDFITIPGEPTPRTCPVSSVRVTRQGEVIHVALSWKDAHRVAAEPGFKNRYGQIVATPLDLLSRAGQPCDAIECFFDLRDEVATGRPTANADANPEGIVRIGLYQILRDGKLETRCQVAPEDLAPRVALTDEGDGKYALRVGRAPQGRTFGFSMRVTDTETFAANTPVFHLTGSLQLGHEPMGYARIGLEADRVFYRIGY